MKILIHDYSGHPFQIQLSKYLAEQGYNVLHVYSGSFQTPKGNFKNGNSNLEICELKLKKEFKKYSYVKRRHQEMEYGNLVTNEIDRFMPDVLISGNTPLDAQKIILKKCGKMNIPFIFWVQDIYSIAIRKILSKKYPIVGDLIGLYYCKLEQKLFKLSAEVIVISKDFCNYIDPYLTNAKKSHVIENWAPINEIDIKNKNNVWARKFKFNDKKCFIYSGTLGMKHNPELLLRLSLELQLESNTKVIVISEGLGAEWLKAKKLEYKLNNLIIMDFQPFENLPDILGTADVLIAILEKDSGEFSVPSKVLTYLCAGRPILLSVPLNNLSAKIVEQNEAGYVVEPDDINNFVSTAKIMINDSKMCKEFGIKARNYAEQTFDINKISQKFISIIESC